MLSLQHTFSYDERMNRKTKRLRCPIYSKNRISSLCVGLRNHNINEPIKSLNSKRIKQVLISTHIYYSEENEKLLRTRNFNRAFMMLFSVYVKVFRIWWAATLNNKIEVSCKTFWIFFVFFKKLHFIKMHSANTHEQASIKTWK